MVISIPIGENKMKIFEYTYETQKTKKIHYRIYQNPSKGFIKCFINDIGIARILIQHNNLYMWDAELLHYEVIDALNLNKLSTRGLLRIDQETNSYDISLWQNVNGQLNSNLDCPKFISILLNNDFILKDHNDKIIT